MFSFKKYLMEDNDSGRRRSLVLVPRNTRYPPVEGVTKGPLSLSLPMDDELSAQSQDFSLFRFISAVDSTCGRRHMAASV